jgi:hypothetical protein
MSDPQIPDEPPPVLKTWPRVYAFVLIYLAALIVALYGFTRHYAP